MDHCFDIGADHGHLGGRIGTVDRAHGRESGIVHQHIDRERPGLELGGDCAPGRIISQVGDDHLGPDAVGGGQFIGQPCAASPDCGPPV